MATAHAPQRVHHPQVCYLSRALSHADVFCPLGATPVVGADCTVAWIARDTIA